MLYDHFNLKRIIDNATAMVMIDAIISDVMTMLGLPNCLTAMPIRAQMMTRL